MWNPTTMELMPGFWPPKPSRTWNFLLAPLRTYYLKYFYRIAEVEMVGTEHLTQSIPAGDGFLIAPNHSHDSDPHVMMHVGHSLKKQLYFMAAWQVFLSHKGIDGWVMQRFGAFSVDREGCDRRAMRQAVELLTAGKPLVVFPEGEIYHTNERLTPLREGVAFMAVSAQRDLEKDNQSRQIWVVPTCIKYKYVDDITPALERTMTEMEARLLIKHKRGTPLHERITVFGEALLGIQEKQIIGKVQAGELPTRLSHLINTILDRLENEHFGKPASDSSVPLRVKTLRRSLLEKMCDETAQSDVREIAHDELEDLHLVLQLYSYPGDYVESQPTVERMAETIEKFEEDLLGSSSPKGRRKAIVQFAAPLDVKQHTTSRARAAAGELTQRLEDAIRAMMEA